MSRGGALAFVIFGVAIAFWAGMWWRHNTLAWDTHKVQAGRERDARKAKWSRFRLLFIPLLALVLYLYTAGRAPIGTANEPEPAPSPSHSTHAKTPPTKHPTTPPS